MDRIGNEIQRELSRSGSRDAVPLAAVTSAWPAAVGDAVARHAWPLRISRDGTLHVAVESATWAQELSLLEGNVLEALRGQLGETAPAKLRFAVGPIPEQPAVLEPAHEHAGGASGGASGGRVGGNLGGRGDRRSRAS